MQVRFTRQQKFIMYIDIDMTNCIQNQHTEDFAVNLIQQWKRNVKRQKKKQKYKKKNSSKKTGTLNTNQELTRKIKQTYNNRN